MHRYVIPEAVKERVLVRQGRLTSHDEIEATRTALVVIDMQNHFVAEGFPAEVPLAREIVPTINQMARAVRTAGGQVAWVQTTATGALQPSSTDLRVKKVKYSAFIAGSSDLDAQLKSRGVETVLIAGTATNVCSESSARDAMMLDYRVIMLSDANATWTDEEHTATLNNLALYFGDVMTASEAISKLAPAKEQDGVKVSYPESGAGQLAI
jgi:ureidoacrylate peracid hydrolase